MAASDRVVVFSEKANVWERGRTSRAAETQDGNGQSVFGS
jgi:hypothetical protein